MRQPRIPVLALTAAAAVLAGCGGPAYRLAPSGADVKTVQIDGRDHVWSEQEGLAVAAAFEARRGGHLVFHVVVSNNSGAPAEFDPAGAACRPDGSDAPVPAADPAKMLAEVRAAIRSEKAGHESDESFDAFMDLVDLVDEFAGDGGGSSGDADRQSREERRRSHEQRMAMLAAAERYWKEQALGRSTIEPKGSARGAVHFRTPGRAGGVALSFRVGRLEFRYRFARPESAAR
jgi:hypothetical protein